MKYLLTGALAALFSMSVIVHADDLSDRKAQMKALNGYLKILNGQKTTFSGDVTAKAASDAIVAFETASMLFGEKGEGETKALDSIWSDSDGFATAFSNSIAAAKNLKQIGESNDEGAFGDGFNQLAQTCGGCHRTYRARGR